MKKIYLFLLTLCVLGLVEKSYTRSKSNLRHLKNIRVGKSKTIRGYNKITINPKSTGDVHITETDDNKHKITALDDGIIILNFYDADGGMEEKIIDIKDRRSEPRANVSFGFGFGGYSPRRYYYYGSDPFYTPWGGWGPYSNRSYYNYYW